MNQQKLDILFISSWFPNKENPTLGNFVEKHAEAVSIFAKVTVLNVCFHSSHSSKMEYIVEKQNNLDVHQIYLKRNKNKIPVVSSFIKLCRIVKAYQFGFQQIYKNSKPDIVHANILIPIGVIAYYFNLTKKIPYIITEHWTGYLPQDANKPGYSILFYRFFAKKAEALIPVTRNLALAMQNLKITTKFFIIPNVVETKLFKLKQKSTSTLKRIIHISSLVDEQKNISGILFAIKELIEQRDDFQLEIISDGDFEQYRNKIAKLGIADKIIFYGKKNTDEVAGIIQQCDFLLLFSNYENFPCVIAEAMSCGIPVLSTDVGGISEHINNNNGLLIESHNTEMLVKMLDRMLNTCRVYNSAEIRDYAETHFSYHVIGKQYFEVYKSILNKKNI
ncbi:MAG: glycosyltransferase family 4 protein [Bacteroidales bacterium]